MDKLNFAIEVVVVGLTVVMVTLFLLYGILVVFSRIFNKKEIKDPNSATAVKSSPKVEAEADNNTLSAVITAAIYSYLESNAPSFNAANFRVTAPAAGGGTNSWQLIGRRQLLEGKVELETTRRNLKREKI
ncbi:MAG: hypothetical protein FJ152_06775 [Firmicutes bacterium]|nr:hypothetical protein [Bacillota bacterium]